MQMDLHHEVRRQAQPLVVRERHHPQERGDPTDPRCVRLDEVRGARLDQPGVLLGAGEHLAGGHRGIERRRQRGMPLGVVRIQRLLDPGQLELFQGPPDPLGGGPVPLLIGVHHHRDAVAEVTAYRLDAPEVGRRVGLPHLDLDAADAPRQRRIGVLQDLFDGQGEKAAGGVVAGHGGAVGTEELGERQARAPRLEVPQGDVEGGDGLNGQPAAAHRGAGPDQLPPEPPDVAGVLADQLRRYLAGVRIQPGTARPLRIPETQPRQPGLGDDPREDQRDLDERFLPAREHLGVTDRLGQREPDEGDADGHDAISGEGHDPQPRPAPHTGSRVRTLFKDENAGAGRRRGAEAPQTSRGPAPYVRGPGLAVCAAVTSRAAGPVRGTRPTAPSACGHRRC